MDILSGLSDPALWQQYFAYKQGSGRLLRWEEKALSDFIAEERYLLLWSGSAAAEPFPRRKNPPSAK